MGWTCAAVAISSPNRIYTPRIDHAQYAYWDSICYWHASKRVFESSHSPWDFVDINFWLYQHQYYLILQFLNINQYYQKSQCYSILLILLNITDITQYYSILLKIVQNYSISPILPISNAKVILKWFWIVPGYYSSVWYSKSILLNITYIAQYYLSNITQYS